MSSLLTGSANGLVHLGAFLPQCLLKIADVKTQMSAAAMAPGGFSFHLFLPQLFKGMHSVHSPAHCARLLLSSCNHSRIVKVGGYLSMQSVWVPVKHDAT